MTYIVMAYVVMAHIGVAYIAVAHIVMAHIVMTHLRDALLPQGTGCFQLSRHVSVVCGDD